jgi:hypothetical protein
LTQQIGVEELAGSVALSDGVLLTLCCILSDNAVRLYGL